MMTSSISEYDRQIEKAVADILGFHGGVIDTSTLIYLDKLGLIALTADSFNLYVIEPVAKEFGKPLPGAIKHLSCSGEVTDTMICKAAAENGLPVISEDKQVLMTARKKGLVHFNCLMLLLTLFHNELISVDRLDQLLSELKKVARYSGKIFEFGSQVRAQLAGRGLLSNNV